MVGPQVRVRPRPRMGLRPGGTHEQIKCIVETPCISSKSRKIVNRLGEFGSVGDCSLIVPSHVRPCIFVDRHYQVCLAPGTPGIAWRTTCVEIGNDLRHKQSPMFLDTGLMKG